jgi:broad specificity phosphatase PhoE
MSFRLFVVRHGVTDWARERRFAGWQDIPLSEAGRRQCEAVAGALEAAIPAAVCASPLERTRVSAEIIAKPHRLGVALDAAFREMGFGQWEGLTREEVAIRFPGEWETWRTAPERFAAPGGEALPAVAERVAGGLAELRAEHEGATAILVTHAIVSRLIVLGALGLGPARLWAVDSTPAGITELEYRDDWVTVHRMNTLAHLDGLEGRP